MHRHLWLALGVTIIGGTWRPASADDLILHTTPNAVNSVVNNVTKNIEGSTGKAIPGLNAGLVKVPSDKVPQAIEAAKNNPKINNVETINKDWRSLFSETAPNTNDLSEAQKNALAALRSRQTTGELDVLQLRPAQTSQALLHGALSTADGFPQAKSLTLNLLPDVTVDATQQKIQQSAPNKFIWYGKIRKPASASNATDGSATFTVDGDRITGTVIVGKDVYIINPLGDGMHAVIKTNPAAFPSEHPPSVTIPSRNPPDPGDRNQRGDVGTSKIKALVVYSDSVEKALSETQQKPIDYITQIIADLNKASIDSRVNMSVSLSAILKVNYNDGPLDTEVSDLTNTSNHDFISAHRLRDKTKSQVVFLLTTTGDYCGLSKEIMADPATAFAVVNYVCARENFSLSHEFGHLLGLRHDRDVDPTDTPFKNGHGYVHHDDWRTILAYPDACGGCPRINRWSNPSLSYEGSPTGTAEYEDEASVINKTAPVVEKFR